MARPRFWRNVATIFRREVRDQVRDRRTLFMVFLLPILLYPILGIGILQLSAAFETKPRTVVVVGSARLPGSPALLNAARDGFDPALFSRPKDAERLKVEAPDAGPDWLRPGATREAIRAGLADAIVEIPPDVADRIAAVGSAEIPILYDSTDEASQVTYLRLREVVERWRDAIVRTRLARDGKPAGYTEPVAVVGEDVAPPGEAGGSIWARVFPFLLVLMALTGAFYPAIDLCAGEKERGTMETLLISPAGRSEIVLGKFFTVMLASMTTALLNLVSMGLTGLQLASQVGGMGARAGARMSAVLAPPAASSYFWMILILIPLSAFFGAICVALAVLARSMKEGQYYMTPLYLGSLPLILVTLAPEVSLNLFFSMIPITGPSLLLKSLILGEYAVARQYFLPVLIPTAIYAWLALRWAVDLFRREDVVFREAEGFDLRSWFRGLVRDKEPTPTAGAALFCFAAMLGLAWFSIGGLASSDRPIRAMVIGHALFILGPPVAMSLLLTSDPLRTLRLRRPRPSDLALAVGLALALNPAAREVGHLVDRLFPASDAIRSQLGELAKAIPDLATGLLVLALMPAITEEVAFRGFILSGLRRTYPAATAILLSAFLFGFLHVLLSLFQQLFGATLLGLVLGLLAIRSGSLWPGVAFHFVNNALAVLTGDVAKGPGLGRAADVLFRDRGEALYRWPIVAGATVVALGLIWLLDRSKAEPEAPAPAGPRP